MRKIELTYPSLYLNNRLDRNRLSQEIEKAVDVNVNAILDRGAYRHRVDGQEKLNTVKVTVEIMEG